MKKTKTYRNVKFDAKTISAADAMLESIDPGERIYDTLNVDMGDDAWFFNLPQEFFAAVDQGSGYFFSVHHKEHWTTVTIQCHLGLRTLVTVAAENRAQIERVFSVFSENEERCRIQSSEEEEEEEQEVKVFIGHGGDSQWKDLKDHLHEKHGYTIVAYEIGARAGHSIRDVLEDMLDESSIALLVMTGEDMDGEGKLHARENVIHETGLFQGRLGFSRAIILLEHGTEEFSNIAGIQQIRFAKGNIATTFGDVLSVLKREFP